MQISNKCKNLQISKDNQINIPEFLYISEKEILSKQFSSISTFLNLFRNDESFIIRSASSVEDGMEESCAGLFFSSKEINACDVFETVLKVYLKNCDIKIKFNINCQTNLILQRFIQCEFGGVIFTPWKYFYNHFLLEVSNKGPSKVVSGEDSQIFLLSKDGVNDILPLHKELQIISSTIRKNVIRLSNIFDFPMDIEWGYCRGKFYILQIRPVTSMPNAILNASKEHLDKTLKDLQMKSKGHWAYTSLSESLGIISPLTFSLFQTLFKNAKSYYNKIGFMALNVDFLAHLPNGSVVINVDNEIEFFKATSVFTSFWRAYHEKKIFSETINFLKNINLDNDFAFNTLSKIFGYWQIANIYHSIFTNTVSTSPFFQQNEYELSYPSDKEPVLSDRKIKNWADAKNLAKELFLSELRKVKKEVIINPVLAFADWGDFISTQVNEKNAIENYNNLVKRSVFNIPLYDNCDKKNNMVCISGGKEETGYVFSVDNPHLFNGEFPDNCILIAPFFRNDWITNIEKFKGIILENGGFLSHSAIVAREKNIVYFIHVKNAIKKYAHNIKITLIPRKNKIKIKN